MRRTVPRCLAPFHKARRGSALALTPCRGMFRRHVKSVIADGDGQLDFLADELAEHAVVVLARQLHEAAPVDRVRRLEHRGDRIEGEAAQEEIPLAEGEPRVELE